MENPQIRPGLVKTTDALPRIIAFFRNSAEGNVVIQLLITLGVPADRIAVTQPERIEHEQGMLLDISCPTDTLLRSVETLCHKHGAEIHKRRR